jgi:hypothetical protein
MPRFPTRPALVLLGVLALLCLAACAPMAAVRVSPTATTLPAPTATPTTVLAPMPTTVPAGWKVLATTHFSLAYPPDWTPEGGEPMSTIWAPAKHSAGQVLALPRGDVTHYCRPESSGARPMTCATLPMTFQLTGRGNTVRVWEFANAQQTRYQLSAGDMTAPAAVQAQDEVILATFRPDNATPWQCSGPATRGRHRGTGLDPSTRAVCSPNCNGITRLRIRWLPSRPILSGVAAAGW